MMNNFNIGDKVRIKKLSEKEYNDIYVKKYKYHCDYNFYLIFFKNYFNEIFEIKIVGVDGFHCKNNEYNDVWFFKEEIEKVSYLKTKFKIVNKLLNNDI